MTRLVKHLASYLLLLLVVLVFFIFFSQKYNLNKFTDPNNYPSPAITEDVTKTLETLSKALGTSSPKINVPRVNDSSPIVVNPPVVPTVKKTIAPPPPAPKAPAITPPGLVFQPNPITIIVPTSTPDVTSPIIVSNLSYNSSPILTYTNKERTNQGLKPLADNATLDQVAKLRLDDLFANQYFDHASPDGKSVVDLVKLENYNYLLIGENIALGNFGLPGQGDDQGIVSAWMASPDHRENILNAKYQELGIAERADNYKGQTETIAVQVFGEPSATCSKPSPNTQDLINTNTNSLVQAQAQAKVMYDNLNTIKNDPHLDKAYYNQKTQEYNYYAKQINDAVLVLKNMVDLYNSQVSKYNACIGA